MLKRLLRRFVNGAMEQSRRRGPVPVGPDAAVLDQRAHAVLNDAVEQMERGRLEVAERLLHEAIELKPDFSKAHFWLGQMYGQRGALEDAADSYELAIHFDPGNIAARSSLAALHRAQGRQAQAVEHYVRVVDLSPDDAAAHTNLSLALHEMGVYDRARQHGERAITIDPKLAEAHHNLGLVLRELGEPERAVQCFLRALELKPRAEMAAGLAHAYRDLGRLNEAIANYDRALRLKPDLGDAVINRAYSYLLSEDFGNGWAEYEERFSATGTKARDFGLPPWKGEALQDKTILVHAEQGLGDEIMFASCLPDLIAQAGRVIIECNDRLEPLFRRSFPRTLVHGGRKADPDDWVARLAPVHYQIPIGSLPRWFRPDRAAFDRAGGYLHADRGASDEFRRRIGAGRKPAIGLSWRGGTTKSRRHLRSIPLEFFAPLFKHDAVFVSLQHGVDASELHGPAAAVRAFDAATDNLDRLAALISALDLVVSVDNTNVQLAGALGRPVWALLSASPEWRYGLSGETMPWYPSAKLFRQGNDGRWGPVIEQVTIALSAWRQRAGTTD